MKNVLIVDDEKTFLLSLLEGLSSHTAEFNTLIAENGKEASDVLRSAQVDLVVTDLKMPEMDGFELLIHMNKNYPGIPVLVMTAYCTPDIKSRLETINAFPVLEKPLDFKELVENILRELSRKAKGYIRGIELPAFLQLIGMERKTCTLKIKSKGKTGYLYFNEGELMDADSGTNKREKAAFDIVCWDEAEIEIDNICRIKNNNISTPLNKLLLEGFRIKDERLLKVNGGKGRDSITDSVEDIDSILTGMDKKGKSFDKKEEKMNSFKAILSEFIKLQGVNAVCLVGRDGFLLDSTARSDIDVEMVGAIASSGFGASEAMGRQLGKGSLAMSMIEFEKGPVLFSPIGDGAFLVIVADGDTNLGMIRLKLKKLSGELALAIAL